MSAAIAVLSWALRRFRQIDKVLSSLKLQGTPPWGGISKRVFLSEPVQTHCTAEDPSRHHPCLSVSIVSAPLLGQQVVNSLKCLLSLMSWWALLLLRAFLRAMAT